MGYMKQPYQFYNGKEALERATERSLGLNDKVVEYGMNIGEVVAADYDFMSKLATANFIFKDDTTPDGKPRTAAATVEERQRMIADALASYRQNEPPVAVDGGTSTVFSNAVQAGKIRGSKKFEGIEVTIYQISYYISMRDDPLYFILYI